MKGRRKDIRGGTVGSGIVVVEVVEVVDVELSGLWRSCLALALVQVGPLGWAAV